MSGMQFPRNREDSQPQVHPCQESIHTLLRDRAEPWSGQMYAAINRYLNLQIHKYEPREATYVHSWI